MFSNSDQVIGTDELKAKWILELYDWIKSHVTQTIVIVILLILVASFVYKAVVWYCKRKDVKTPLEVPASKHVKRNVNFSEFPGKRITTGTAPRVDPKYSKKYLPKCLDKLMEEIDNGRGKQRVRCCVVCPDESMSEHYARSFYKKVVNCEPLDFFGWIYYKKPEEENQTPGIKYCLFKQLCIFTEGDQYNSPDKRYRAVSEFFHKPEANVLLVISDKNNIDTDDDELKQMTSMDGLSIVMFSTREMDGFDILRLNKKGGGK